MSAPIITQTAPGIDEGSVVLGRPITITFDQPMDPTTINEATFSLTGPGQTSMIEPKILIEQNPTVETGREYITGTFAFPHTNQVVFTPSRPLRPGVTYTVLLAGSDSILATSVIKSAGAEALVTSYQFSYSTGTLNLVNSPVISPVPIPNSRLNPCDIRVIPGRVTGNDLTQQILLLMPGLIDTASVDPAYSGGSVDTNPFNDIIVSCDAVLNDPLVPVPAGIVFGVTIVGNQLQITVTANADLLVPSPNPPPEIPIQNQVLPISNDGPSEPGNININAQSEDGDAEIPNTMRIQIIYVQDIPTEGAWNLGDRAINIRPIPGGNDGWVCVEAGAPGIWLPYGTIGTES